MESEKVKKRLEELQLAFSNQVAENKKRMDDESAEHMRVFQQMIAGVAASLGGGAENAAVEGGEGKGMAGVGVGVGVGVGGSGEEKMQDDGVEEGEKMPDNVEERDVLDEGEQHAGVDAETVAVPKKGRRKVQMTLHRDSYIEKDKTAFVLEMDGNKKAEGSEDEHVSVGMNTPRKSGAGGAGGASGSGKGMKGVGGVAGGVGGARKKEAAKKEKICSDEEDVSMEAAGDSKKYNLVTKFNDCEVGTGHWYCLYCKWDFPESTRQNALIATHMDRHHGVVLKDSDKGRRLLEEAMRRTEGESVESMSCVRVCCWSDIFLCTGGASDAKAKDKDTHEVKVESVTPVCAEDIETTLEEKFKEEKKLTKKLNARIKQLEADAQKNAQALALGVECAQQLLSKCFIFFWGGVRVCVCVCVCVCVLIYARSV